ncbi:MAG TPA: S8 family serine peptidase [Acidimicrobiales bacterium]|nr:S8 family serine peptidase [Acidimicrobiales bacterium]
MRKVPIAAAVVMTASLLTTVVAGASETQTTQTDTTHEPGTVHTYVVLAEEGASVEDAAAAAVAGGATVVGTNAAIGMVTVEASGAGFASAMASHPDVVGAARDSVIGSAPEVDRSRDDVERLSAAERAQAAPSDTAAVEVAGTEPLASLQWDMDMIDAPAAHAVEVGDHRTKVGIMDTGIDGSHPDIAPNFNAALSRNFTTDIPLIDGACNKDPDRSCEDPADVDENGHGTHVAGTIGSPLNGVGIAGVAPGVELVNLRAGQDSGYFFLEPTVNALTYAGDNGIDVVNMSFYIDPWLFNCTDNPADTPEQQAEQRTIIEATQRALDYASAHGVTLVSSAGNGHTDLGNPTFDGTSPDYPPGTEHDRVIDNSCLSLPTEGDGVVAVTAVAPSGRKSYYSNYGIEQADIAAPGGDYYDTNPRSATNLVLAPYPEDLAIEAGEVDKKTGASLTPFVVADCTSGDCSYYQYLQGTSMASPHVTGVAALIVAAGGGLDAGGEFGLHPRTVVRTLLDTATDTPCPNGDGVLYDYDAPIPDSYNAVCDGRADRNGFYGDGIVNASAAVSWPGRPMS